MDIPAELTDKREALVEALFAGDTDRVTALGRAIVAQGFEEGDGIPFGIEVADGTLLEPDQIPDEFDDLDMLEGHVTPTRLERLCDGAKLTKVERRLAQDLWVRNLFEENPDCDSYALWQLCSTTDGRGRTVYTATIGTGYSFTEVNIGFVGAFATLDEAYDALKQRGYINHADYQQRHRAKRSRRAKK